MKFSKVVRIGTEPGGGTFCKIEIDDGRLSISGVEGPKRNGNAIGGCGQIAMHLSKAQDTIDLAPGWTREMLARFFDIWDRYHLNDMQAGTPAQTAYLRSLKFPGYPISHYDWACGVLAAAGLNPDPSVEHSCKSDGRERVASEVGPHVCLKCGKAPGYAYGSAWLKIEVPEDVIKFLKSLPDTDVTPAWV